MNQGDCDFNHQCQFGLRCGTNNCPTNSTYLPTDDCCTDEACDGTGNCCTIDFQCGRNEGHCDKDEVCKDSLRCKNANCLNTLPSSVNCCEEVINGDWTFCSSKYPCGDNDGDCDNDNECKEGLKCGSNNCDTSLGFHSSADCCYDDVIFCKIDNPCNSNEGDCDTHAECQDGLVCGSNNCLGSSEYDWFDCCYNANNGDDEFCTIVAPCRGNQGDCDFHKECQDGLVCGSNNCQVSLGFDSEVDCCYNATLGDEDFCTALNPCRRNEGDCDSNPDCQDGIFCGYRNCPPSLGFNPEVDCCGSITHLVSPNYPELYPRNVEEIWGIIVPVGFIIDIEFLHFHVRKLFLKYVFRNFLNMFSISLLSYRLKEGMII